MLLIHIHGLFGSDSCLYPHHLKVSNDFWVAGVHRVHQALSPELLRWPAWRSGLLQLRVIHQVHQKTIKKTHWLVVWNMNFMTFHILGMSSYQLTFIFCRGVGIPPTSLWKPDESLLKIAAGEPFVRLPGRIGSGNRLCRLRTWVAIGKGDCDLLYG